MDSNNSTASTSNNNNNNNNNDNNNNSTQGPAWTNKPITTTTAKKKSNKLPFNRSTSSSLSGLPVSEAVIEAPFLNHNVRHHGVYTLSPPDNMGRRRQPDSEFKSSSHNNNNNNSSTTSKKGKEKERKKKFKNKTNVVDPEILQAVENVGRTPSPLPSTSTSNQDNSSRPRFDRNVSLASTSTSTADINTSAASRENIGERAIVGSHRLYSRDDLFDDDNDQDQPLPVFMPSTSLLTTIDSHSQLLPSDPSSLYDPPPAYPSPSSTTATLNTTQFPTITSPLDNLDIESDGDESQEEEFVYHASDPFVIAWESDRAAGLSLDERILRDLLRRKGTNVVEINMSSNSTLPSNSTNVEDHLPPTTSTSTTTIEQLSSHVSPTPSSPSEETLISHHIRNEIQSAELARDAPRVARALSVLASNSRSSIGAITRGRRVIRGRGNRITESARDLNRPVVEGELSSIVLNEVEVEERDVTESESEDDGPSQPARMISINAGSRFAEAAERRLKLAKLEEIASNESRSISGVAESQHLPDESSVNNQYTAEVVTSPSTTPRQPSSIPTPVPPPAQPLHVLSSPILSSSTILASRQLTSSSQPSHLVSEAEATTSIRNRPSVPSSRRTMNELRAMFESPNLSSNSSNNTISEVPPPIPRRPLGLFRSSLPSPSTSTTQTHSNLTPNSSTPSRISDRSPSPSMLSHISESDQQNLITPLIPTISPPRLPIPPIISFSPSSTITRPPLPIPPSSLNTSIPRLSAYEVVRRIQTEEQRPQIDLSDSLSFSPVPPLNSDDHSSEFSPHLNPESSDSNIVDTSRLGQEEIVELEGEGRNTGETIPIVGGDDFVYTDLDLLLARLDDRARDGSNYDELMLVSELLGPSLTKSSSISDIESLNIAKVELDRRRIDKLGRVKQKLSVVGVRCGDCSVCLGRFKVGVWAVVLPRCLHIFHADCIRSWLLRSKICPLCRSEVFEPLNIEI